MQFVKQASGHMSLVSNDSEKKRSYFVPNIDVKVDLHVADNLELIIPEADFKQIGFFDSKLIILKRNPSRRLLSGTVRHFYYRTVKDPVTGQLSPGDGEVVVSFENVKYPI